MIVRDLVPSVAVIRQVNHSRNLCRKSTPLRDTHRHTQRRAVSKQALLTTDSSSIEQRLEHFGLVVLPPRFAKRRVHPQNGFPKLASRVERQSWAGRSLLEAGLSQLSGSLRPRYGLNSPTR